MRFRLILLTFACALASALVPLSASAEPRMLVGFQDDPSLRWRDDRQNVFDVAEKANAGIVRTTVSGRGSPRSARRTRPTRSIPRTTSTISTSSSAAQACTEWRSC